MSNFSVVDGDIRLTTSGGGQLLHTDDQNRLKVVMDMVYVSHTLSGTDHIGQLSDDQVMVSNVTQHESYIDHNNLTNYLVAEHRTINDGGAASTDLWSASKISSEIASSSGTTDHSALDNLDYASAGHTGFSPASHLHDDRYYTESEINTISGSLSTEIDSDISTHSSSSDHDDRYYTESEINTISGSLQTNIDSKPDTLLELTDTPSNYDSDKYLKSTIDGTEWATVSGGGGADHNIADHLDTSATGAELNTLTDNSIADALHRHSELVASDGSPDPALSVDVNGIVNTNGAGIQVNSLGSGNRETYIDLITDDTYTDYGLRIIRTAHANGNSVIYHRGTGNFNIITLEESPMYFYTHNTLRVTLASDGKLILTNGTGINEFSTDGTLVGDSDDAVPTEKAVATAINSKSDNILINQDFTCWQDGTTFTNPANGVYTADGYFINKSAGGGTLPTINVKKNTADMEVGFEQCCELEITNVGTGDALRYYRIIQNPEDYKKYRGKTVTLSIKIKSSVAMTLPGRLWLHDGVGNGSASIASLTTSWQTFTVSLLVSLSNIVLWSVFCPVAGAGDISTTGSIYIQWMKLELGSVATPLIPRSNAEEYLLCGTVIAPLNRTNPSVRFEDDAGNLGIEIVDGGKVNLANGTGINEFSTDGTLAGDSDDAVPTEKAVKTYVDAAGGVSTGNDNVWSETQLYSDNSLTCASTTTWDMETYQNTYLLLDQDTTLSGTVPSSNSGYYTVLIKNNGSYTLTLDGQFLTPDGEDIENTTTSGSYDLLGVYLNNGLLFATMSTNFS